MVLQVLWHVLWHVLSCSVVRWLCLPWLFPPKPLVRKLMQMFPMMQVVMAACPIALPEFLSRDVLASYSFELYWFMLYFWCCLPDLCCMFGFPFQISPYCYSTWCCFVPPLVMSKYIEPPTWKKAVPLQVEDCSIIPSYLPLICCKFSGWLCKRLQWASPAVQWGEVLPKK